MQTGQLYTFGYRGEERKVIFIEEDKKQLVGVTLKVRPDKKSKLQDLPKKLTDEIMKVVNAKIFSNFSNNPKLVEQAMNTQKEMSDRALARMLLTGKLDKVTERETLKFMELLVRRYDKKKIVNYK